SGQPHYAEGALSHLAKRELVIGVAPHQRRQVEGHAEPAAARLQQPLVPLVAFLRRAEPRELPHRPQLAAVAARVDTACVRERAGAAEVAALIEVLKILGGIKAVDRSAGDGGEGDVALAALLHRIGGGTFYNTRSVAPPRPLLAIRSV